MTAWKMTIIMKSLMTIIMKSSDQIIYFLIVSFNNFQIDIFMSSNINVPISVLKDHYFLEEEDVTPDAILGVKRLIVPGKGSKLMALITYMDGRVEFVPTELLAKYEDTALVSRDVEIFNKNEFLRF